MLENIFRKQITKSFKQNKQRNQQ